VHRATVTIGRLVPCGLIESRATTHGPLVRETIEEVRVVTIEVARVAMIERREKCASMMTVRLGPLGRIESQVTPLPRIVVGPVVRHHAPPTRDPGMLASPRR
jgi:hypothetical protein